jgi:hypothetical protein
MPRHSLYSIPLFTLLATPTFAYSESSSSRPGICQGWNISVRGDWLYWQANETGLGYALNQDFPVGTNSTTGESEFMGSGKAANPSFAWSTGFRAGLNYNIPHDQWDVNLLWSYYDGNGHNSQHSNSEEKPTILTGFIHPNAYNLDTAPVCMSANSHISINLNVIDLDLGRQFKTGKWLSLRPYLGAKAVWLDQTYNIHYNDVFKSFLDEDPTLSNYLNHMTNNFWGMGAKAGLGMDFGLRWGISLFSDLSFSLLYGLFDTSRTERYTLSQKNSEGESIDATVIAEDNEFHAGRAVADIQIGLRWTKALFKERIRLLLQTSWEQHMFFSQNQFMRFSDPQYWGNYTQNQGDVYFQGISTSIQLYF